MDSEIVVRKQILTGNMGDGWPDEVAAAYQFAELAHETWSRDLEPLRREGYEIDLEIEVEDATGYARPLSVETYPEPSLELEGRVRGAMTEEDIIWQRFCDAANFSE